MTPMKAFLIAGTACLSLIGAAKAQDGAKPRRPASLAGLDLSGAPEVAAPPSTSVDDKTDDGGKDKEGGGEKVTYVYGDWTKKLPSFLAGMDDGKFHVIHLKCVDDAHDQADAVPQSPPLSIDDADTPGCNTWEVNIDAAADMRRGSTQIAGPHIDLNYGIGNNVQLKAEIPMVTLIDKNGAKYDLGNAVVGIKWKFYENEKGFSAAFYPQYTFVFPGSKKGTKHLDSNTPTGTLLFIGQQELPKAIMGHDAAFVANLAYNKAFGGAPDSIFIGAGVGVSLSKSVAVEGDVNYTQEITSDRADPTNFKRRDLMVEGGVMYQLNDITTLYAGLGVSAYSNAGFHLRPIVGTKFVLDPEEQNKILALARRAAGGPPAAGAGEATTQ